LFQNGLMLMLPGVLNGRKTAFSLFLREIRLRPTITYAISAPKLYNSATKLSSPERASATDTEENAIIEMNWVLRILSSLAIVLPGLVVSPEVCDTTSITRYPDMAIVIAYRTLGYVVEVPK